MPSLGLPEIIVIVALALIVFGPKKLPEIGKKVGQALREFQKVKTDLMESVTSVTDEVREYANVDLDNDYSADYQPPPVETLEYAGLPPGTENYSEPALPYGSDFVPEEDESDISMRAGGFEEPVAVAVRSDRPSASTSEADAEETEV